jgi:hypothetical protein
MPSTPRDQILELLAANPEGLATLAIVRHFGERKRSVVVVTLGRLAARGHLIRSTEGKITESTVWRLLPPSRSAP